MDVIGFLCVPLGSSTVQLHDSLGSTRAAHVQKLVSVVKMATVLECILLKSSVLLCIFLWAKGPNAKDIHTEIFPVYRGKCHMVYV
jgi:hypothetical protein